ncbi:hypothetical protein C8R46DRAFT_1235745 [Mycena filopes]|nr:hypothetical protein C8R46DRAFT_1235745 [Mycena filopes]
MGSMALLCENGLIRPNCRYAHFAVISDHPGSWTSGLIPRTGTTDFLEQNNCVRLITGIRGACFRRHWWGKTLQYQSGDTLQVLILKRIILRGAERISCELHVWAVARFGVGLDVEWWHVDLRLRIILAVDASVSSPKVYDLEMM